MPLSIKTLLVEPEAAAARALRRWLKKEAGVAVIGAAKDGPTAVEAIRDLRPDLVFLDIQLPGFDGFEVLERVSAVHRPIVVVVSAHDRYAVRAFEAHALDYLVKPMVEPRVHEAIRRVLLELTKQKALRECHQRTSDTTHSHAINPPASRLVAKNNKKVVLLATDEIDWCEAAENYVRVHARSSEFLVRMTMNELEQRLAPHSFVRTHRSMIVNVRKIADMSPASHGDYDVKLQDGTVVRLSRSHKQRLLS